MRLTDYRTVVDAAPDQESFDASVDELLSRCPHLTREQAREHQLIKEALIAAGLYEFAMTHDWRPWWQKILPRWLTRRWEAR